MKHILLFFVIITSIFACAQDTPVGRDLIIQKRLAQLSSRSTMGDVRLEDQSGEDILVFETLEQPKFIYKLNNSLPIQQEKAKNGTVFLLSFEAKTITSSEETGEAKVLVQFKQSDSFKDNLDRTLNLGSTWKVYHIPFQATQQIAASDLGVAFQYGFDKQSFGVKNLKFEVFPKGTSLQEVPQTEVSYLGMKPDAEWRKMANARINKLRKSDFELTFTKDGKPLKNASVHVELVRHQFPFGVAMHAQEIINDKDMYERMKKDFGLVVLANDLKIKRWEKPAFRKRTLAAIDKLRADNISVKGHVLVWPGYQYNSDKVKQAAQKSPERLEKVIKSHMYNILDATAGNITHWDVVNEAYTNRDFQKVMGSEQLLYDALKIVKNRQPQVGRFVNEYGIISKGGIDDQKQKWYYDYIQRLDENSNGAVQGIGIQSHMGTDLTPPEKVLGILSYYATLGKQIGISEFTMDETDPKVREQYTRDFLIAAFSHPSVSEFLFWGFQEDGRGKVDIYEEDGTVGEMGRAFFSLVNGEWKTTLSRKLTNTGTLQDNGFQGLYKYTVTVDGKEKTGYFEVKPRSKNKQVIEL